MFVTHSFVLNFTNRIKVPIKRSHPSIPVHWLWTVCSVTDQLPFLDVLIKPLSASLMMAVVWIIVQGGMRPFQGRLHRASGSIASSTPPPSLYLFSSLMPRLMLD